MAAPARAWWRDPSVIGMTVTSFCADVGYEMVSAVLPGFLASIGVAAAALGWIEGLADALSSFVKLFSGAWSDRIGRRKPIVALGYFLSGTALSVFAAAVSWPLILVGRLVAWFGRGVRGPLRDAMLAESAAPEVRGRVFGMHRAGDTAGAVAGPLIGVWLLWHLPHPSPSAPFRTIFLVSLIPGLMSFLSIVLLVAEKPARPGAARSIWGSMRQLPGPFRRFLVAIGIFGAGDFAPTLLVLAAAQLLAPHYGVVRAGQLAALYYVLRNLVYAIAAFPAGALADRMNKQRLLSAGFALGGFTAFAAAALFLNPGAVGPAGLAAIFAAAGVYIGIQDSLEGAIPADLVPTPSRGSAYGVLGAVNGVGDLIASALVGTLWTVVSPQAAFAAAGLLMFAGAGVLFSVAKGS
ncbi:MAG TPA: MFS transporter [Bryobacteraceae bacterium]|nr:MFS transporter [Bryobacteraceae bacterium]